MRRTPRPASLSSPPGRTSATTAITLAVPMSSPTTRSLYSFAMFCPACSLISSWRVGARWCRRPSTAPHSRRRGAGRPTPAPRAGGRMRDATCVSVCTNRCVRAATSSACPRPSSITAPVSSSSCQLPRAVSASSLDGQVQRLEQRLAARGTCASTCADCSSGPASRGSSSCSTSPDVGLEHLAEVVDQPRFAVRAPEGHRPGAPAAARAAGSGTRAAPRPGAPRARASKACARAAPGPR